MKARITHVQSSLIKPIFKSAKGSKAACLYCSQHPWTDLLVYPTSCIDLASLENEAQSHSMISRTNSKLLGRPPSTNMLTLWHVPTDISLSPMFPKRRRVGLKPLAFFG